MLNLKLNLKYSGIEQKSIMQYKEKVEQIHQDLHSRTNDQKDFVGWLNLPTNYDKEEFERIKKSAQKIQKDSEVLIVIGIGGSYLGARAVIESLTNTFYNMLPEKQRKFPQILYVGNNLSPNYVNDLIEVLGTKDFSINVISKSGTTTEPAIAFRIFREILENRYGIDEARSRIYVTTDKERGALKTLADEDYYNNLDFFELEKVKTEVGPLIKYLRGDSVEITITNFNDKIESKVRDVKFDFDNFRSYREKIITYLRKHFGELNAVKKIINLDSLNEKDLSELQEVLNSLKNPVDNTENFNNTQELIVFIRKIIGLDKKAIDEKCAKFLNNNDFNKEQRQLINLIIDFAIRNGNVTAEDLVNEQPFCDIPIQEMFDFDIRPLIQLVNVFNSPLIVSAAA